MKAQQLWWRLATVVILVGIGSVMGYQMDAIAELRQELLELRNQVWELQDRVEALQAGKAPPSETGGCPARS